MDSSKRIKRGNAFVPTQTFNGKTYYLYEGEKYFSKGTTRLHRVVWETSNGEIPAGYHVHHVDGDTTNNDIDNLNLVHGSLHARFESKKRFKENPEWVKEFQKKGIEAAKEWHKSEEGLKWHSEHGKKTWVNRDTTTRQCDECGNEYETHFPTRSRFCHQNCKAKANRRARKLRDRGV